MILPLLLALSLAISQTGSPDITFVKGCENIIIQNNKIFLEVGINGMPRWFDVDFGKAESKLHGFGANSVTLGNNFFAGSCVFEKANFNNICQTNQGGSLGYEFFRKSQQIFLLDFDSQTLCNIDNRDLTQYINRNFVPIESDFRKSGIFIDLTIKRKIYRVKLDTGYHGTLSLHCDAAEPFIKDAARNYKSLDGDFAIYPNKWVTLGKHYYNAAIEVGCSRDSRIGMGFIKGFNWIVDFKKHEVYFKKNSISLDAENTFPADFSAGLVNGKLAVISKAEKATKYPLGSIISSVDGIAVTSGNLCEIYEYLRQAKNWDDLNIEVENR